MIGQTVSHYRIIEELGAGGMGVVYKAEDTRLGRTVALKFLSRDLTSDAGAKERFLREARAISAIEHPNICTIHEVDETESGATFICMACYGGHSLRERLKTGPLPMAEAVEIAAGVARGLQAAHAAGIVHRDIKPGNIMLTEPGVARIIDFGLAKLTSRTSITAAGVALGTVAYMSPEQARGACVDRRTDVWSLGAVLYEMVAGRPPFEGERDQAIIRAILSASPETLLRARPGVPPELDAIVRKALAKDPSDRYQETGALLDDLKALSRVLDAAAGTTKRVWGFTNLGRRTALRAAVAVGFCAAAVAIVWLAVRAGEHTPVPVGRPLQVTAGEGWEGQPAMSPDGGRIAYVSDESGNYDIYMADVHGGSKLRLTDDPAMDYSPTWFPDGTAIAFVSERGKDRGVWKVSQLGGGATPLIDDADSPAISPDGTRIAFSRVSDSGFGRIFVVDLASPSDAVALTGDDDGLWEHWDPAWSPDGSTICYAARHNLWTVPASGGRPRPLTDVGEGDTDPAWSSDGRHIYFSSDRGGTRALWRVSRKGGDPERLTSGSGFEGEPTVDAAGSKLAYSSASAETRLVVHDRMTGAETEIAPLQGAAFAVFFPDRQGVVFESRLWGANTELGVLQIRDGEPSGAPRRLTDQPGDASHPAVSPDGKWIAYYRIVGDERDLWIVPTQGGQPARLTDNPASDMHPAWSPDGHSIAFVSDRDGGMNVWVLPLSEGAPAGDARRVTRGAVSAYAPAWSRDGASMAFVGMDRDDSDVWIVPSDGSAVERRLTTGWGTSRVLWDPAEDGRLLVSARRKAGAVALWSLSAKDGGVAAGAPPLRLGSPGAQVRFDVSHDGALVLFARETLKGDIWVLEADRGSY